jgi:hypothetical protein
MCRPHMRYMRLPWWTTQRIRMRKSRKRLLLSEAERTRRSMPCRPWLPNQAGWFPPSTRDTHCSPARTGTTLLHKRCTMSLLHHRKTPRRRTHCNARPRIRWNKTRSCSCSKTLIAHTRLGHTCQKQTRTTAATLLLLVDHSKNPSHVETQHGRPGFNTSPSDRA